MSQAGTVRGWLLIALALVTLVVLSLWLGPGGRGGNDTSGGESTVVGQNDSGDKSREDTAPKFATDAESMAREFDKDSSAAEKRYKDTWVEVTGVVTEVDSTLKLAGGTEAETATINCHDVPDEKLSAISEGDFVIIHGKFKESGDDGLELEPCRLYLEGEGGEG